MGAVLLDAQHLHKTFPGVRALVDVSLQVHAGEIVAVVGHNGSGKSTLVKILAGVHHADSGTVTTAAGTSTHGRHQGLHFIHQDLGLVPTLTTIENLDLSRTLGTKAVLPSPVRAERRHARELIGRFAVTFDVDAPVATLTPAQRTIVAIARALDEWSTTDNVLVLDEPTAALQGEEVGVLFDAVRRLAAEGAGVILISHRLDEVVDLADRVVVLRDGQIAGEHRRGEFDRSTLVALIAGEAGGDTRIVVDDAPVGAVRLAARDIAGSRLSGVDLDLCGGEIVGVTGLLGSGVEQLAGTLFGACDRDAGTVTIDGRPLRAGQPSESIDAGVGYVPADRRRLGAIVTMNARENLTLPRLGPLRRLGQIRTGVERAEARAWMDTVGVRPAQSGDRPFGVFSGGNQQKIVIAKWLRIRPCVLLLEEPTQGVDVAAQAGIHDLIRDVASDGTAVLVVSTDAKELVSLSHRVLVLHDGRVSAALTGVELTERNLVRATIEPPSTVAAVSSPAEETS